jgi:1-aminocyclopropane-1-carboxylate deaminase/D-cysteine desulfhydrase-like pyridoxal-dependent ACC family enzyme
MVSRLLTSPSPSDGARSQTTASRVVDEHELTPYERHGGRWYKRDDLYMPYDDLPLSGGKVRQAIQLLHRQAPMIRSDYGGVVLTATGVHSPQGLIIARVCAELDLRCVLFIGATTVGGALIRHPMLRRAVEVGATIDSSARVAYEPAMAAAAQRWRERNDGAGYVVRFGINLEDDPDAILGSTAAQVANTPDEVRKIVIAVGAGVTAAGVIIGCREQRPDISVVCVQIAGYDRTEAIDRMAGRPGDYEWHVIEGVPYSRHVQRTVDDVVLDPIYEAKAHDWLVQNTSADRSVAFWLVGDSTAVRSQRTAAGGGGRRFA